MFGNICAIIIIVFALVSTSLAIVPLSNFFPFGTANGDATVPPGDDSASPAVPFPTPFPFFNSLYTQLFVNINGFISMNQFFFSDNPTCGPLSTGGIGIVAPYFTDVITDIGGPGNIFYRFSTNPADLAQMSAEIANGFPGCSAVQLSSVFIATWSQVTFFDAAECGYASTSLYPSNTYQAILGTDGVRSYALFYYNNITWTSPTDLGGNCSGLGGNTPEVGFDAGDGVTAFFLPGSCMPATVNINSQSNVNSPGKFLFQIDGTIQQPQTCGVCTAPQCPLSLVAINAGNPNPCDTTLANEVISTVLATGCNSIRLSCPAGTILYEVFNPTSLGSATVVGNADVLTCQQSPPAWISSNNNSTVVAQAYCANPSTNTTCPFVVGQPECAIPPLCYTCPSPCALLNYPNTNIALQINPQFTFNNQPYSSSIFANGLAECGNDPFTTLFPTATNTSVQAVLSSGQFIGLFTCPFAMCVCTDGTNGTIDCFRGNSTVQILLVPVLTPAPNFKPIILGVVLQSNISTPAANWGPPSNLNNLLPLAQGNYVKINHLACVSASSALSPVVCPMAALI